MTTALFMLAIIVMGQNRVDAASWGAKNLFTTPKKTRGTWYYKHEGKIKKLKIATHTFNKIKLYKMLSSNKAIKWTKKLAKADKKSGYKLAQKVGISQYEAELLEIANQAHPSIVRRGGGAKWIRVRKLDKNIVSIDLAVDVQEAMGANMLNTMLEAIAATIREKYEQDVVMSILSNYATECLATAICDIPVASLAKNGMSGEKIAEKIAQASYIAQIDPYRATTHNKGIMNGIDGVVIASGNDWRAIEAGAHAYAAKDGSYRGLSTWKVIGDTLHGEITLPLPLGSVGGSIGIVPLVKVNHKLLEIENAIELEKVVASVGLGQNLAALYALVTEGIQKGHMRLQLKSLVSSIGATEKEIPLVVSKLEKLNKRDMSTAKEILDNLRNEGK